MTIFIEPFGVEGALSNPPPPPTVAPNDLSLRELAIRDTVNNKPMRPRSQLNDIDHVYITGN